MSNKPKPLVPLWALVIGPFWIIILLVWFIVYSLFLLIWVMPVELACDVFGWQTPTEIRTGRRFSDHEGMEI